MQAVHENQFFHLTFHQYIGLNQRPQLGQPDLMELISNSEYYEALRAEILKVPIEHEEDADLLASLKRLMDPIEGMRNCVAHNRRPTRSIADNYPNARGGLEELLNEYLAGLEKT